jgi:transposase
MAGLSGPYRSQAIGVHRRDLDEDQHHPPARLGAKGRAPGRQGPGGKWKTATFLAALRSDCIDAPCLFDRPINGERFHAYVEQFLVPTLKPGDVVILDNLGSHKGKTVRKAIRDVGARLVFLPKYSPDLNPIEQVFAKLKTLLRKVGREASKRSPTPAAKSSPNTRPPNAPHTSRTQDTRRPKCRTL